MPDTVERTIYKLELDGSGYIRGVDALSASTQKFTADQEKSNRELKTSETVLKSQSEFLAQTKRDLEAYTGTNEKYRAQLQKSFQSAQVDNQKLTDKVIQNRLAYEAATKAATDFANVSSRASNLQAQTTGGKIPTGPPPGIGAGITQQIAGVLNVAEFTEQAQIIEQTKNEFNDLAVSITLAEERMKQLNAEDEEFKQLAPIVAKGKEALEQYGKATKVAGEAQGSLRSQLRPCREELVKLEQAGLGATKQYFELEKRVAKLTDQFGDQQQRIKILASDTKALDFGKGAITAATSAFQAFTAVSILAGDESAELQKKTMQLFAAMQLLQSLEQLSNLTRREGVLATLAQSGAQSVYTAVVGASTGALKTFRLALLGTGIGAAIVLIGFLVSKWSDYRDAVKKAGENQKLLNEVIAEGNKEAGKQIADLKILTKAVQDSNIPMKERLEAVKQLQKEFPDYFGNLTKEAILTGDITAATKLATEAIIAASRARAAKGKIDAIESERLDLDAEKQRVIDEAIIERNKIKKKNVNVVTTTDEFGNAVAVNTVAEQLKASKNREKAKLADIKDQDDTLQRKADFLTKFVGLDKITKTVVDPAKEEKTKTDKAVKEIQNEFERKKAELEARLAELNRKEADNESKVRIEFQKRLLNEQLAIEKLVKEKKIKGTVKDITDPKSKSEAGQLGALAVQVNDAELTKALADFNKKVTDARQKLNDDLQNLQNKNTQDTLNLLQDEFTRRAQLIEFNEQRELEDAKLNTTKRIASLELDRLLIGEKAYQDARALLISAGEQNALNIIQRFAQQRQDLAFDMILKFGEDATKLLESQNLGLSRLSVIAIQQQNELLATGKISFEAYQKAITEIGRVEGEKRIENEKKSLRAQINLFSQELVVNNDKLNEDQKTKLLEKIRSLEKQLSDLEKGDIAKDGTTKIDSLQQYAEAIGRVADSVIQFWQAANQAESAALDRSIALQEKRVDAAQRIAERGNAQYLKAEEDRLTELNIKRENAARKQLGIDAALQASQILVGITGAIAKISTPGIGIAETIGAIAVIIGALATGYGLVKSLQGNQPKLREGTTDLKRQGHPAGVDTIPAWLNEHEAVIPAHKNKKYKQSVEAIYHEKVPAEVLNTFVENYVKNKKETVTKKTNDLTSTVHKVFNETTDKKITYGEVQDFINRKNTVENKTSDIIKTVTELVKSSVEKKKFSFEKLVNENISFSDVQKYSKVVDKVLSEQKKSTDFDTIIRKVVTDVTDKKLSLKEFNLLKTDTKTSTVIENIFKQVSEKLDKKKAEQNIYSEVITRVFNENKKLIEQKNLTAIVKKVLNETVDKNISIARVNSLVNEIRDKKTSSVIDTLVKLVQEKSVTENFKKSLVNESVTLDDIHKYSEIINIKRKENIYKQFVQNVSKVPAKVLNNFIEKYHEKKFFKGTTDLQGKKGIDQIPIWASEHEAIIPAEKNNLYKPVIKAVFDGTIPAETFNSFVNNYHQIKAIPQPNYQRIKEAAELHVTQDGRMSVLLTEQNKKIEENNDLQRQTLRAMKNMAVSANIDRNGVAIMINEYMTQMEIDKKL